MFEEGRVIVHWPTFSELGYQGSRNHIERWPSGHETGPDGLVASLLGRDKPKEPVAPGLMQRSVISGGRGSFDSKPYDHRLPTCSLWVCLWSLPNITHVS